MGHDEVRRSYDAVAEEYAAEFRHELDNKPLDRALLAALIEQTVAGLPIADLGCGPGQAAGWIAARGARAVGIDLSPREIEIAREEHPDAEFRVGDFLALPAADKEFGAALAFYSIIHLELSELGRALGEMHRVIRPPGLLLVSFHVGTQVVHRDDWFGHEVDVDFQFLEPERVEGELEGAGFVVEARLERVNYPDEVPTRRAYVVARRGD